MSAERLTNEDHRERSRRHEKVALALHDAGDEWCAVMFFYAAYHEVKAALLVDPVFDDLDTCLAANPNLQPEDRLTARHQGRKNSKNKEWGLNELVVLLYRGAGGAYHRLHTMSVDVRYHRGLRGTCGDAMSAWQAFCHERDNGALTSGRAPHPHPRTD